MKSRRQKRIIDIINQRTVRTQDELTEILKAEGISVTQATVSRDIKELHLIKVTKGDGYAYSLPKGQIQVQDESRLRRIFRDAVLRIVSNESLVVIHTLPGNAHSVCSLIDTADWDEYLGAVAGDDTILVAAKSTEHTAALESKLKSLLD